MEPLGAEPENDGNPLFLTGDEQTIYFVSRRGLMKWEIGAPQWTTVYEHPNFYRQQVTALASPDERWITRLENGKIEIRGLSGGDWKPLISLGASNQIAFTPGWELARLS